MNNTQAIATRFGVKPEQVRAQFAALVPVYAAKLAEAERTGRKVSGNTADQWRAALARVTAGAQA